MELFCRILENRLSPMLGEQGREKEGEVERARQQLVDVGRKSP